MGNIWIYKVIGKSCGIVKAHNREEAEIKVRDFYSKYDARWHDQFRTVIIKSTYEMEHWFPEYPDVLEVIGTEM